MHKSVGASLTGCPGAFNSQTAVDTGPPAVCGLSFRFPYPGPSSCIVSACEFLL